jgi:Ca2+-binding EF-hand superfamily protein
MSVWRRAVEKNSAEALPTESEIKAMIAVADLDKDGALDEEEFMRVINTVIPPPPK